jgi:hypothetical protein
MKEEYFSSLKIPVYEKPIPTEIPEGKTPIRSCGATFRSGHKVLYDEIVFLETHFTNQGDAIIKSILVDRMCKRKKCRSALSWGCLIVDYNIFNIEENKWEGFGVRKWEPDRY